jgi:hypothetical protein
MKFKKYPNKKKKKKTMKRLQSLKEGIKSRLNTDGSGAAAAGNSAAGGPSSPAAGPSVHPRVATASPSRPDSLETATRDDLVAITLKQSSQLSILRESHERISKKRDALKDRCKALEAQLAAGGSAQAQAAEAATEAAEPSLWWGRGPGPRRRRRTRVVGGAFFFFFFFFFSFFYVFFVWVFFTITGGGLELGVSLSPV